ncbi:hypothetical protein [Segetibacter aerophilus]|nr:hypothetical protein [Segetibacter aerophilus]
MRSSVEEDLLKVLLNNPSDGITELYDVYASVIYGSILKTVNDTDKASDILLEVFKEFIARVKAAQIGEETIFFCLYKIAQRIK